MKKQLSRSTVIAIGSVLFSIYVACLLPFILERYSTSCDTETLAVTCTRLRLSLRGEGWIAVVTFLLAPIGSFLVARYTGGSKVRWVTLGTPTIGIIILSVVLAGCALGSEFGLLSLWRHSR